jgi:Glycosyl hydrolases family 16
MKRLSAICAMLLSIISCNTNKSKIVDYSASDFPPNDITKQNYRLEFNDEFSDTELSNEKWVLHYLPQWSSKEKSKPNYHLANDNLILEITQNQLPWCPEFNGKVKCSSIQTGLFSGKLGSQLGQHRFNPLCVVREEQDTIRKYTPQYGYFEIRARAISTDSNIVVALWMIGFEDTPEKSGEICIVEIKGKNVSQQTSLVGYGIHPFGDETLRDEFYEDTFNVDVTDFHVYAASWTPDKVDFYFDNRKIRSISQSPHYPMQIMLNIYELPVEHPIQHNSYPKQFEIDYIRAYKPIGEYP